MLKEELGIGVSPRVVSPETEALTDLRVWVDTNLDDGLVPRLFDRHRLISETIYGPIMRSEPEPGFNKLSWLGPRMSRLYKLEPVIIYCIPSLETVERNLKGDPLNSAIANKAGQIYQSYVSRISLDLTFAPRKPLVWDYETSPNIKGKPTWLPQLLDYTNELLNKEDKTWAP